MKLYLSQSYDIYFNLALENWLFLEALENDEPIIFLWKNRASVVIGRAQNPWKECNLEALENDGIPIVRRQSGGGTVYHDLGNLNYTIISSKKKHNVKENLKLICDVIKELGINIQPNERNDIVYKNENGETFKVSGSAFREKKDRAFHHGTLLINANTDRLYKYLHHKLDRSLDIKGVKSHRSKVCNIGGINGINIISRDFYRALLTLYTGKSISLSLINEDTPFKNQYILDDEINSLKSWDWTFGKTLPFKKTYTQNNINLIVNVKKGYIESIEKDKNIISIENKNIRFNHKFTFVDILNMIENQT